MKILVIGGNGMAGHLLVRYFYKQCNMEVSFTIRENAAAAIREHRLAKDASKVYWLDVTDYAAVEAVIQQAQADIIVNAVGVLNAAAEAKPLLAYQVNGLLPHWLRHLADQYGARLIHISSDCVFFGDRGSYGETEQPDGTSVYAKSKALGEVKQSPHLSIRTSIIGPEIRAQGIGLLQWFLRQYDTVSGYSSVHWNGVTTLELAKAVHYAVLNPSIAGLVHLAAPERITKYDLLCKFRTHIGNPGLNILAEFAIKQDRTLAITREDWQYAPQPYDQMLAELADWMRQP